MRNIKNLTNQNKYLKYLSIHRWKFIFQVNCGKYVKINSYLVLKFQVNVMDFLFFDFP